MSHHLQRPLPNAAIMAAAAGVGGYLLGVVTPRLWRTFCTSNHTTESNKKNSLYFRDEKTSGMSPELHEYVCRIGTRRTLAHHAIDKYTMTLDGLSQMCISPDEGQFLTWIVSAMGFERGIEVGTFTGYGSLCLALGLPGRGKLVTIDITHQYLDVAKRAWKEAGVDNLIDMRKGQASDVMADLLNTDGPGSFDFVFIDADKDNYDDYYEKSLKLLRKGGVILVDNTMWSGHVIDPAYAKDPSTAAIKALNEKIAKDARVTVSLIPVADGLTLARKL